LTLGGLALNKSSWLSLGIAGGIAFLSFWYLAVHFPYPQVDQQTLDLFLPWVSSRIATNTPYKYWWPMALLYIPTVTYGLWLWGNKWMGNKLSWKTVWLTKTEKVSWPKVGELGLIALLLIFLLVNFSYNAFYMFFYNYHHLNFITGPLNDLLNGKVLLVDTKAQYGFLNIFLSSWLFRAGWYFSHPNVHFLSMVMGVLEYLAVYLIMRILTKSKIMSFLGIILTTGLHFYGVFPVLFPSEFFLWPGGSVWRFFPAMPSILMFLWWSLGQSKISWRWLQVFLAIGLLWNLETGVPLIAGYLAALISIAYLTKGSWSGRVRELLLRGWQVFGYTGAIMALYSLYGYLVTTKWPDWSQYYYYTKLFNSGFLQRADHAPTLGYVYWPILVYGIILGWVIIRKYCRGGLPIKNLPALTMLAVYGYGIFRYYLGKQNPSDWAAIVIPAVVILVYFYHSFLLFMKARENGGKIILLVSFIVLSWPLYKFATWSIRLEKHRLSDYRIMRNDPGVNYPPQNRLIAVESTVVPTIPITELMESARVIQKYTPNKERVAIIGYFDHVLLMQAERVNLADYYYLHATLYTKRELEEVINLYRTTPTYLFVDKRVLRQADEYKSTPRIGEHTLIEIFERVRDKYEFVEDSPMLYVYRRID